MAFWGIEVKPGTPITHSGGGRLRISQATLGIGDNFRKTTLQCNVGNRTPVLLCVLLPNKTETCLLNLEFEEAVEVVFSVIGPRSIYLSGYYIQRDRHLNSHSDSESYGLDIENTETDGSSYHSDDDDAYEDSFIDDDDEFQVIPESPVLSSKGTDEVCLEDDVLEDRKCHRKLLRRKYCVFDSENTADSHESEENGLSLSVCKSKSGMETTLFDSGEKIAKADDETKDNAVCGGESKQMVDLIDSSGKPESVTKLPLDEKTAEVNLSNELLGEAKTQTCHVNDEKFEESAVTVTKLPLDKILTEVNENNEHLEEVHSLEEIFVSKQGASHGNNIKGTILPMLNGDDQMQSLVLAKCKRKRKACPQIDNGDHGVLIEAKEHDDESSTIDISVKSVLDNKKTKKKKKKSDLSVGVIRMTDNLESVPPVKCEDQSTESKPITLSNGMIIEQLERGLPDGKVAAPGRKVKIYYTGMLKESGHVFDSNVGKDGFRFRLGDEGYIDGWNVGIEGMHVGDKRRLIIPPEMGFGGLERKDVPPNSWLSYEIELVGVRK